MSDYDSSKSLLMKLYNDVKVNSNKPLVRLAHIFGWTCNQCGEHFPFGSPAHDHPWNVFPRIKNMYYCEKCWPDWKKKYDYINQYY